MSNRGKLPLTWIVLLSFILSIAIAAVSEALLMEVLFFVFHYSSFGVTLGVTLIVFGLIIWIASFAILLRTASRLNT